MISTGGFYLWFHGITKKIFIPHGQTAVQINSIQEHLATKTPITIVLLGYGGGTHDGAYLTDSMLAIHIDPKQQKITLISVPRDLWVKIPTDGPTSSYWKINAAYEIGLDDVSYPNKQSQFKGQDGGGHLAEYMVSEVVGFPVDYFVGMDFSGFKHTIDTLSGVDITVETAFTDTQYPIDGKEADLCGHQPSEIPLLDAQAASTSPELVYPCRYENLHFDSGLQHMDGERALSYVRSRHSLQDGTDFGRAKRQRNLLIAVKQKILSPTFIPQIIPFITSLGDDFKTDLSSGDIETLLSNVASLNKYTIDTLSIQDYLADANSNDGQAILQPKDGLDNWTSIHTYITDTISGKPQQTSALVRVENGTSIPGLAGLAVNRLKNENIKTLDPKNYDSQTYQQTTITVYDKNISQADLDTIKKEFGTNILTYDSSKQSEYNVLVIVGNDYNEKEGKKILNEP